jgi:hypothetical protein
VFGIHLIIRGLGVRDLDLVKLNICIRVMALGSFAISALEREAYTIFPYLSMFSVLQSTAFKKAFLLSHRGPDFPSPIAYYPVKYTLQAPKVFLIITSKRFIYSFTTRYNLYTTSSALKGSWSGFPWGITVKVITHLLSSSPASYLGGESLFSTCLIRKVGRSKIVCCWQ